MQCLVGDPFSSEPAHDLGNSHAEEEQCYEDDKSTSNCADGTLELVWFAFPLVWTASGSELGHPFVLLPALLEKFGDLSLGKSIRHLIRIPAELETCKDDPRITTAFSLELCDRRLGVVVSFRVEEPVQPGHARMTKLPVHFGQADTEGEVVGIRCEKTVKSISRCAEVATLDVITDALECRLLRH